MGRRKIDKAKSFNLTKMQQGHSIPFQVKEHLKNRRKWEDGLTCLQLVQLVKHSTVKFARINLRDTKQKIIKKKKVSSQSIYKAIRDINRYSIPAFYIMSGCGKTFKGITEHRYFIPKEDKHFFAEEKKIRDSISLKMEREQSLQNYRSIEVPLENKYAEMRNNSLKNI